MILRRMTIARRLTFLILLALSVSDVCAQNINRSSDRVAVDIYVPYQRLGTLIPKGVSETRNNLTIGCETLDRDYTDYESYKHYLEPLGLKKIRLQAGWAKTEKVKGVYDFKWLDDIINDAVSRGLTVWLETSYGNPIYEGGGTPYLGGGMPRSKEAKNAWDRWVEAMAIRYKDKGLEWEIWNEPDLNDSFTHWDVAELNIRTAEIIKKHQPDAKIAALAIAGVNPEYVDRCFQIIETLGKVDLFTWVSYHGYIYRPEDSYHNVERMKAVVAKYSPNLKLRQGENGAPSAGYLGGALDKHPWTETTQAKWALRRMLGDHGRGVETSVFTISDIAYGKNDGIKTLNVKGLLQAGTDKQIIRPKIAYYSVQNLASIFDLLEDQSVDLTYTIGDKNLSHSLFGYKSNDGEVEHVVIWMDEVRPTNYNATMPMTLKIEKASFRSPVWVDLLTGGVYDIPSSSVKRTGTTVTFEGLPIYDSPILVTDKSNISYAK